jgi:hypothetical protein
LPAYRCDAAAIALAVDADDHRRPVAGSQRRNNLLGDYDAGFIAAPGWWW